MFFTAKSLIGGAPFFSYTYIQSILKVEIMVLLHILRSSMARFVLILAKYSLVSKIYFIFLIIIYLLACLSNNDF